MTITPFIAQAAQQISPMDGLLQTAPMIIFFIAIFYFIVIRPQQKEQQEHDKLLASLQKGDKVVTKSGLHGEIHEVGDGVIVLKIAEKTRVTMDTSAVKGKATAGAVENKS
ncbi:MAG: preprotein translocase subunit YajC [Myxococcota bacterium]|nr:preprotein translocase subunit YajC [Myxococcota bacterium]